MKSSKKLLLALFAVVLSTGIKAQDLIVTLTNTSTETFPISDIQSIKFGVSSMILYELDGTVTTWDIDDVDNYAFKGGVGLSSELNIESNDLNIYPNPASNLVNLTLTTTQSKNVTIDIVDVSGKIVENIYQGEHQGAQTYKWNSNAQKGTYYCRINTGNKIISKPIVVQ